MPEPRFSDRSLFAYDSHRFDFAANECLRFDEKYRMAQLPLVVTDHPLIIDTKLGLDYDGGRYDEARRSLVVPVSAVDLAASPRYSSFICGLDSTLFNAKISHAMARRREDRLHVTVAGGLAEEEVSRCAEVVEAFMHRHGGLRLRVMGPYVGRQNSGRMYLPVIPQEIQGEQAFGMLQSLLGLPRTNFYAIGLFNFVDELTPDETRELQRFIQTWKDEVLLELHV